MQHFLLRMCFIDNEFLVFKPNDTIMKDHVIFFLAKPMVRMFILFCTCLFLSFFTACSPGYGCNYAVSENISEQADSYTVGMTIYTEKYFSDDVVCLP